MCFLWYSDKKRLNYIKKGCNVTTISKIFCIFAARWLRECSRSANENMFSLHSLNRILVALINIFRDI